MSPRWRVQPVCVIKGTSTRGATGYQSLKHVYTGDFHPLGPYSTATSVWTAWQFDRADLDEGLVQAFRRQDSPAAEATYRLAGLDSAAEYSVSDLDDPKPRRITGRDLMDHGLSIHLPTKPAAAIFVYKRIAR